MRSNRQNSWQGNACTALATERLRSGLVRVRNGWATRGLDSGDLIHFRTVQSLVRQGVAGVSPDGRRAFLIEPQKVSA